MNKMEKLTSDKILELLKSKIFSKKNLRSLLINKIWMIKEIKKLNLFWVKVH